MTSAISYKHRLLGFPSPADSFVVKVALKGSRRSRIPDKRKPITLEILGRLVKGARQVLSSELEWRCFNAVCCVLFFGFLRVSEVLGGRDIKPIQREQVLRGRKSISLTLMRSKTSSNPAIVKISRQNKFKEICPVRAINKYLVVSHGVKGSLFLNEEAQPLTQRSFRAQLSEVLQVLGLPPSSSPRTRPASGLRPTRRPWDSRTQRYVSWADGDPVPSWVTSGNTGRLH